MEGSPNRQAKPARNPQGRPVVPHCGRPPRADAGKRRRLRGDSLHIDCQNGTLKKKGGREAPPAQGSARSSPRQPISAANRFLLTWIVSVGACSESFTARGSREPAR